MIYKGMLGIVITTIYHPRVEFPGRVFRSPGLHPDRCSDGNSSRESSRHRACPDPS